ncbi:MAG: protein kinase, partial [Planctomycetota bacterium]
LVMLEQESDTLVQELQGIDDSGLSADGVVQEAISRSRRMVQSSIHPHQEWPKQIGPYELVNQIGQGGMGAVFLARHAALGKRFALKLARNSEAHDRQLADRFDREITAAGGLNHSAIVDATDAGEVDGWQYLAMEFIDGADLGRILKGVDQWRVCDACEVIRQAAIALGHAHARGVVHRDIKPSNVMIRRDGAVKLLDFGLAQLSGWDDASVELTTVGRLLGTLDYMSPEQADRPESVDYRADLYSLGATLFKLLCGRAPLSASPSLSPLAKLRLLAEHEVPSISTLREDLPDELAKIIDRLLDRDPTQRPASADVVAEALKPFCTGHDLIPLVEQAPEIQLTPSTFARVRSEPESIPPRKSSGRWLLAAAMIPIFALAGFGIMIETNKGQFVIESEVPETTVQLLENGKLVEEVLVESGSGSTKIRAGKYEIRLASPSESVAVTQSSTEIRSGEVTIARIRRKSTDASITDEKRIAVSLPASDTPLQPGETIRLECTSDPSLDGTFRVFADHTIKVRLAGVVNVKGLSLSRAEDLLRAKYGQYMRQPKIELFRDGDWAITPMTASEVGPIESQSFADGKRQNKPTYDGKTLDEWLVLMERERKYQTVNEAMDAAVSLVTAENSERIVESMVRSNQTSLKLGFSGYNTTYFKRLCKSPAGSALDEAVENIIRGAPNSKESKFFIQAIIPAVNAKCFAKTLAWIAKQETTRWVQEPNSTSELRDYLSFVSSSNQTVARYAFQAASQMQCLDLKEFRYDMDDLQKPFVKKIVQYAIQDALRDEENLEKNTRGCIWIECMVHMFGDDYFDAELRRRLNERLLWRLRNLDQSKWFESFEQDTRPTLRFVVENNRAKSQVSSQLEFPRRPSFMYRINFVSSPRNVTVLIPLLDALLALGVDVSNEKLLRRHEEITGEATTTITKMVSDAEASAIRASQSVESRRSSENDPENELTMMGGMDVRRQNPKNSILLGYDVDLSNFSTLRGQSLSGINREQWLSFFAHLRILTLLDEPMPEELVALPIQPFPLGPDLTR